MATQRTIPLRELYDLVWSRPMRDVAAEFGISDVGLAKTCARYGIPSPPRGYWARKQAGQDVAQQPLPRPAEAEVQSITIRSTTSRIPEDARAEIDQITADSQGEPRLLEAFPVTDLRKSVKLTALTLRRSRRTEDGSARAIDEGTHGVVVSSAQVERAIFVINGLVRRLEEMDLCVTPEGPATRVSLQRDSFRFRLSEKTRRERHVPTAVELKADAARQRRLASRHARSDPWAGVSLTDYQKSYADWDIVHTGELVVQIEGYGPRGVRQRWADGRRQKIERMIDEIVIGMRTTPAPRAGACIRVAVASIAGRVHAATRARGRWNACNGGIVWCRHLRTGLRNLSRWRSHPGAPSRVAGGAKSRAHSRSHDNRDHVCASQRPFA